MFRKKMYENDKSMKRLCSISVTVILKTVNDIYYYVVVTYLKNVCLFRHNSVAQLLATQKYSKFKSMNEFILFTIGNSQ